jgi:2-oxoglutarate ferredoxin oxidoreductase subunit delta
MSEAKKLYSHVIRENWCKACGICVAYCPKKVLELRGKVVAARPDDCIGCKNCELRCPDFAIEIIDRVPAAQVTRDSACVDYAVPPEVHNG